MERKRPIIAKAADFTVSEAESGAIYLIKAADVVATLPALSSLEGDDSVYWTFIVHTLSSTTGFSISPNSVDQINGGTDDKDLINTAATDALGDGITIVGNDNVDATSWWSFGRQGTWAEEG